MLDFQSLCNMLAGVIAIATLFVVILGGGQPAEAVAN